MNFLRILVEQQIFQALGWSLLHFIWQGSLVAILLLAIRSSLRECRAHVRYRCACGAMLLMLILPLYTAWFISTSFQAVPMHPTAVGPGMQSGFPEHRIHARPQISWSISAASLWQERLHEGIDPVLPWLTASWLTGMLLLSMRRWGGWLYARRLAERDTRSVADTWQDSLLRLCRQMGVTRSVILLESALVPVPTVIGCDLQSCCPQAPCLG
jgi:bla regulator protein blaR1